MKDDGSSLDYAEEMTTQ